jgi:hypothetical protein
MGIHEDNVRDAAQMARGGWHAAHLWLPIAMESGGGGDPHSSLAIDQHIDDEPIEFAGVGVHLHPSVANKHHSGLPRADPQAAVRGFRDGAFHIAERDTGRRLGDADRR